MKFRNYLQLIYGISTFIPGFYKIRSKVKGSGGTFSSRYCYAVWFRHLISIFTKTGKNKFDTIAEVGPGDSIGVGLLALLLGANKYYAFDVVKFANVKKNLKIFYELVDLLKKREHIPDQNEFPRVNPFLINYEFPYYIYTDEFIEMCLSKERIQKIEYSIINQNIVFRDQSTGKTKEVPIASIVDQKNITSFSAIKHIDLQRVVTLYSSILAGSNANEIVNTAEIALSGYEAPQGVEYKFTGEIKQQSENQEFLSGALLTGIALIILLLVFQFNSISKPFIVLASIVLSFTGVFLGIVIFNLTFSILMTMLGIISLTGIIVNNAVVLIDYTQLLFDRKKIDLNMSKDEIIDKMTAMELVKTAGKARLKPVLLTAITTIFGLIPLAVGLNIDFFSLFANWNPNVYLGGDNVIFWGPLAWTVIFGITFATFLTLIIVPSMYYIIHLARIKLKNI